MTVYTAEQRDDMVRRYLAGEKLAALGVEFGCDQSYPRQLAKRRGLHRDEPPTQTAAAPRRERDGAGTVV